MSEIKYTSRISRGQVWWIPSDESTSKFYGTRKTHESINGSVIGKSRPWLIVSNNKSNLCSPIFNAVPITTQYHKDNLPVHVWYSSMRDGKEMLQCIQCEQIKTFSQDSLKDGSYYMYTVSDELMNEVDKSIAIQIIPNYEAPINKITIEDLKSVADAVDNLIASKTKNIQSVYDKAVTDMINNLVDKINDMTQSPVIEISDQVDPEFDTDKVVKSTKSTESNNKSTNTSRKGRLYLPKSLQSVEGKKLFLDYAKSHTTQEVMSRFDLDSTKQVYNYRYSFRKYLESLVNNEESNE